MKKIFYFLDAHLEEIICIFIFGVMTILTVAQVILRHIFDMSIVFAEELDRYLFVWLTFIGISYGAKQSKHLSVDVLYVKLPKIGKKIFFVIETILTLLFTILAVYYSYLYFVQIAQGGQMAASMNVSMKWLVLAPVVGFALTGFRQIQVLVLAYMKTRRKTAIEGEKEA